MPRGVAFAMPDLDGGGVAVHPGHQAIHEDQIVGTGIEASKRFGAIHGQVDFAAQASESVVGHFPVDGVVFDDEHARRTAEAAGLGG